MKAEEYEEATEEKGEASRNWFMKFKERGCLHKIKVKYKVKQQVLMQKLYHAFLEGGHAKHQIFSVDKTVFYWNKLSSRTFHS